jgi:two-component system cell cycle sensor histidine kinase/response regulator CckA
LALIQPEDRDEVLRSYARASAGESLSFNFGFTGSGETVRQVRVSMEAVGDATGRVTHICGAVRDLTKQAEANAAIRSRERLLTSVLESLPVAVCLVDTDGTVRSVNAEGRRILGSDVPLSVGPDLYRRFRLRDVSTGQEITSKNGSISRALEGKVTIDREIELTAPDGTTRQLVSSALPMYDADGAVSGVISINTDVTGRRRLETQLQQAQWMDSIGRMAGGNAHDFNNLLTVIIGCADIALRFDDGVSSASEWRETLTAAQRAAELASHLLAFARQQPVAPRLVNLETVVVGMRGLLGRVLGSDVSLEVESTDDRMTVNIDPGQFEQVLLNLAMNARDAMADAVGTFHVEIRLCQVSADEVARHPGLTPGTKVRLSVTDSGVGIPEAIKARIFEPFFTTKGQGGGTGLGLAMCYGIVKQAGGFIGVESREGAGTTFWIYLPLAVGDVVQEPAMSPDADPAAGRRILLVEDEPSVAELARRTLTMGGYSVTVAHSGDAALEMFAAEDFRPELLVSDVIMPGMRGTVLAKKLRVLDPSLRVIFVSGFPGPLEEEFSSIKLLVKPFRPAELLRHVGEEFRRQPQSTTVDAPPPS